MLLSPGKNGLDSLFKEVRVSNNRWPSEPAIDSLDHLRAISGPTPIQLVLPLLHSLFFSSSQKVLRSLWDAQNNSRAALKGTNLRGQTPICGFLRVPAVFCGFLRKSAVFCENLRFPNASFSRKRRVSAKISENLRESAFSPLRFVPLSAPWNSDNRFFECQTFRRFPMEPFLETLWGPLVPISALLESLFFAVNCYSLLLTAINRY